MASLKSASHELNFHLQSHFELKLDDRRVVGMRLSVDLQHPLGGVVAFKLETEKLKVVQSRTASVSSETIVILRIHMKPDV